MKMELNKVKWMEKSIQKWNAPPSKHPFQLDTRKYTEENCPTSVRSTMYF